MRPANGESNVLDRWKNVNEIAFMFSDEAMQ